MHCWSLQALEYAVRRNTTPDNVVSYLNHAQNA